ncbi:MAG: hypothetical protein ACFBSG_07200 [Leptolyngbyaceae cyanobacterium]
MVKTQRVSSIAVGDRSPRRCSSIKKAAKHKDFFLDAGILVITEEGGDFGKTKIIEACDMRSHQFGLS